MRVFAITILVTSFLVLSCKKEGCTDEYAVNYDVNAKKENERFCFYKKPEFKEYVPCFGPNTATLLAIDRGKEVTYNPYGKVTTWRYSLASKFFNNNTDLVSAGDVSMSVYLQSQSSSNYSVVFTQLNKQLDNTYLKVHSNYPNMSPTYFPNPLEWRGAGDVWPAFNLFNSIGFSGASGIVSGHPNITSAYSFEVNPMMNADSLVLEIIGQRKHISKVIPANESSHVFRQEELESVGRGDAYLRAVFIRYDVQTIGGQTYYLLNAKRVIKEVFIE